MLRASGIFGSAHDHSQSARQLFEVIETELGRIANEVSSLLQHPPGTELQLCVSDFLWLTCLLICHQGYKWDFRIL